jgi:(1->4)-alpha-D-glucan 1-alpha-D-glucosylmutase
MLGALNGLSQLALKALLPGVPDFYQGTEFWDLSLVDPDNRRPVDFTARKQALAPGQPDWTDLATHWDDGRIKLALTRQLLRLRHEFSDLFKRGVYEPLPVTGPQTEHVIAFSRTLKRQQLVVAVGRHFTPLTLGGRQWPSGLDANIETASNTAYEDILGTNPGMRTGKLDLHMLFRTIPVSVLRRL